MFLKQSAVRVERNYFLKKWVIKILLNQKKRCAKNVYVSSLKLHLCCAKSDSLQTLKNW